MTQPSSTPDEALTTLTPARILLATRIASRDRVTTRIAELRAKEHALDDLYQQAQKIAAEVATADGVAAEKLALSLVTVNARIASQGTARAQIASEMLAFSEEITSAIRDVQENVTHVMAEELDNICKEVQVLNEQLLPLTNCLAGVRAWAVAAGHRGDDAHRARHLKLADAASKAIARLCPFAVIAVDGIEGRVEALANQLATSASAKLPLANARVVAR